MTNPSPNTPEASIDQRERIKTFFNQLRLETMDSVKDFYHPDIEFHDPIGSLQGVDKMESYYRVMYENVTEIRFDFGEILKDEQTYAAPWTMTLRASGLNGGEPVVVDGTSRIRFDEATQKAIYHRDYFDMGAMIYEQVPVLRSIISFIKSRFKHD